MTAGRELVVRETLLDFLDDSEPAIVFVHPEFAAKVIPGAPDRDGENGATLFWTDGVANDWAEHYSDLSTAVARFAVLLRCVENNEFFRDSAEGFVRWSDNFFQRTVSSTPQPTIPGGLD